MLKIAIAGAGGRMGRTLIEAVLAASGCALHAALEQAGSPLLGQDAGAFAGHSTGVLVSCDMGSALAGAHVLIDFTRPEGTLAHLAHCQALGVQAVIGTTGFSEAQREQLHHHARQLALVVAPNMSVGVNVLLRLLEYATQALGPGYDVEIVEAHHRHKVDAPSGTALAMGQAVARARGTDLTRDGVFARHGHTGERRAGQIGFATVRGGDIVGDHLALFAGTGERLEIWHRSSSRANYAAGSLLAARFVADRPPGLYGMDDVLGLQALPQRPAPAAAGA